ncbi:acyl-CoA dehydrogenase family protein [Candidatus Riflebacteria bacterium]
MSGKYEALDYYRIEELLSEDERMIRDSVRDWIENCYIPIIVEHYRKGTFPEMVIPQLAELGILGPNLPEKYDCAGVNNVAYGLIMQELERGDSGLRSFASVQGSLVMYPIFAFGSEEQKDKWLPQLAKGEAIGCFGLTEPDFGSDPGGMRTRAVKKGDRYILNGSKSWITNGTTADLAVIWAKVEEDGKEQLRGFLVEKDTPGYFSNDIHGKLSLRASVTSELGLDDAEIPEGNLLPGTRGLSAPLSCLTQARYSIAWGAIGAAQACFDCALKYAKERIIFNEPMARFQLVQEKLTDACNEITKAQLLALRLGRMKDAGTMNYSQVSLAKMNNVQMALDIARSMRDILGANGISDEYPIMRHMLNLESVNTYEGTHDIHTLVVGRDLTGYDGFQAK